jgi:hypothetical protein
MANHRPWGSLDLNPHFSAMKHIHNGGLAGINRGAAKGRISAAFHRHRHWIVSIQISGCPTPKLYGKWLAVDNDDI